MTNRIRTLALAASAASLLAAQPALAGPQFPEASQKAWNERSEQIIAAIRNERATSGEDYVADLSSACSGITGFQMSHRMPNWAAMPQGFLCVAVGELKGSLKDHGKRGGGTAYCGTARRAAGMARKFPQNEDSAPVAATMTALADAADLLTTVRFNYETSKYVLGMGFGSDGFVTKGKVLTCKPAR